MTTRQYKVELTAEDKSAGAFDSLLARVASTDGAFDGLVKKLAAGFGIGYFAHLVKESIDAADHLRDMTKSTGLLVEELAGAQLLARQTGTDFDSLATAINRMSVSIGKDPEAFRALGITAKSNKEAFQQLADLFNLLPDIQQRNALAQKVFGKSWQEMAPVLAEGGQRIGEIMDKGAALSGITNQLTKDADDFNDKWAKLTATGGLFTRMIGPLLPLLIALEDDLLAVQDSATGLNDVFQPMVTTLKYTLVILGGFSFVLTRLAKDFAGVALITDAIRVGNFKAVGAIIDEMGHDTASAVEKFAAWERKILDVGVAARTTGATVKTVDHDAAASASAKTAAFLKEGKATGDVDSAYRNLVKGLREKLLVDRELTESAKLQLALDALNAKQLATITPERRAELEDLARRVDLLKTNKAAMEAYIKGQEQLREVTNELNAASGQENEKRNAAILGQDQVIDQIQFETRLIGMSNEQRQIAIALRALETSGIEKQDGAYTILATKIYAALKAQQAVQAAHDLTEKARGEFNDLWRAVENTGKQAFVHLMSEGKSAFESIGKSIKTAVIDLLYQLTARKWMIQIGAGIETSMFGASANAATNQAANSMLGSLGSSAVQWGASALGMGGTLSGAAAGTAGTAMLGTMGTAEVVSTLVGAGEYMAAASVAWESVATTFASMGPVGWVALAAVAAYAIFAKEGGGPKIGRSIIQDASGRPTYDYAPSGGDPFQIGEKLTPVIVGQIQSIYSLAGQTAKDLLLTQNYELDPQGDAPGAASRGISIGGKTVSQMSRSFGHDDTAGVIGALGSLDTSEVMNLVNAIGDPALSATVATLAANFKSITLGQAVTQYTQALATQKQMLFAMMTPQQQLAVQQKDLATAFADANMVMPTSIDGFRDLVSGLDLTTASGQGALDVLNRLGPAFISQTNAADKVAKDTAKTNLTLQEQIAIGMGTATEKQIARQHEWDAAIEQLGISTNETTLVLIAQKNAQEDAAEAAKVAKDTAATNLSIQEEIAILSGTATEKQIKREHEWNEAVAGLGTTTNQATLDLIVLRNSLEDAADSAAALAAASMTTAGPSYWELEERAAQARADAEQAALQKEQAIANERKGLQDQLDQLTMSATDLLAKQRDALDESNRALFDQVQALTAAAQAQEAAAAKAASVASERYGLETQLLQAQGQRVELRNRERALLDESNRTLYNQVHLQEVSNMRRDMEIELMRATGNEEGALAAEREDILKGLWQSLRPMQQQIWDALDAQKLRDATSRWTSTLEDWLNGRALNSTLSPLTAQQRFAEAQSQYVENLLDAQQGDDAARAAYTQAADAYAAEALAMYGRASTQYVSIWRAIQDSTQGLIGQAGGVAMPSSLIPRMNETSTAGGAVNVASVIQSGQQTAKKQTDDLLAEVKAMRAKLDELAKERRESTKADKENTKELAGALDKNSRDTVRGIANMPKRGSPLSTS